MDRSNESFVDRIVLSAYATFVTSLLEMLLRFITVPDVIAAVKSFLLSYHAVYVDSDFDLKEVIL